MKKKIVGSYPYTNVLFSISAALFMIALFGLFAIATKRLANKLSSGIEMQVILEKDLSESDKESLSAAIQNFSFVSKEEPPQFISKESAAEIMIESTGEDFVRFLGENPLRDAFAVRVDVGVESSALENVKHELSTLSGVYEVVYTKSMLQNIRGNMRTIGIVVVVLSLIFFSTAVILINNSIRLALYSQRFLIRSMQLVGATQMFIKQPFLMRGAIQGAIGGGIASVFVALVAISALSSMPELVYLISTKDIGFICILAVLLGTLVVVSSVYFAISKYLKLKLDDLY
ncbi:cell division protein FtsX [Flammeovirga aprica]|uniref:Cell division protein FtsX n=1 Tax=Flammeovirga aprica JL-4 TaxID=694437 RepID=A0A7X9P1J2_9BACT|nr:permease-like cell division protein FtsX [Flammeovirga aprica]NME66672.1 ABC transporter permease [Flammeovirga aprica JL-4]